MHVLYALVLTSLIPTPPGHNCNFLWYPKRLQWDPPSLGRVQVSKWQCCSQDKSSNSPFSLERPRRAESVLWQCHCSCLHATLAVSASCCGYRVTAAGPRGSWATLTPMLREPYKCSPDGAWSDSGRRYNISWVTEPLWSCSLWETGCMF